MVVERQQATAAQAAVVLDQQAPITRPQVQRILAAAEAVLEALRALPATAALVVQASLLFAQSFPHLVLVLSLLVELSLLMLVMALMVLMVKRIRFIRLQRLIR